MKNLLLVFTTSILLISGSLGISSELRVGRATVDITPSKPTMLQGQMSTRISQGVETPITANILCLATQEGEKIVEEMVLVSLDLCIVTAAPDKAIRAAVKKRLPDFDVEKKLALSTTHTHTAPSMTESYITTAKDIMTPPQYTTFLAERIAEGVVQARKDRQPAEFSFALEYAVVGFNRRAVYADGHAAMYGNTNTPDFASIEGFEDHSVNIMYFWGKDNSLLALIANVSCPAQELESGRKINADYWHPVREKLKEHFGKNLCVLGLCGAAGDLSPHVIYNKAADLRMTRLTGKSRVEMIADRIVNAVVAGYAVASKEKKNNVTLAVSHAVLDLPQRIIPKDMCEGFKKQAAEFKQRAEAAPDLGASGPYTYWRWTQSVVDRYEQQQKNPKSTFSTRVHVVRLGDTVLCTNPFELYSDFATVMKARSKAVQTFVVQLTNEGPGAGGYLPTAAAAAAGGYGAIPQSNVVGPEGGRILTEKTIEMINSLF